MRGGSALRHAPGSRPTCVDERLSANINWTFFSFAVVFPLTFSLNEAFKRRELALAQLAQMKARSAEAQQHDASRRRLALRDTSASEQRAQHLHGSP